MNNKYLICYEGKIIATAWLFTEAESEIQLVTIRPEGYLPDQPITEIIFKFVPATLKDTIAIERAIDLYGLDPTAFTIISNNTKELLAQQFIFPFYTLLPGLLSLLGTQELALL